MNKLHMLGKKHLKPSLYYPLNPNKDLNDRVWFSVKNYCHNEIGYIFYSNSVVFKYMKELSYRMNHKRSCDK